MSLDLSCELSRAKRPSINDLRAKITKLPKLPLFIYRRLEVVSDKNLFILSYIYLL